MPGTYSTTQIKPNHTQPPPPPRDWQVIMISTIGNGFLTLLRSSSIKYINILLNIYYTLALR